LKQFQEKQNYVDTCTSVSIRLKHPEHASYLAHAELALTACGGGASYSLAQQPHFKMHMSSCAC
jgi:hypothetical protein